ncbi:MAG: aminopeptidase P family N-terminal domain-containing protein [Planctomycetota bacterium]|jgi:Xaa-Pro aminopeptidase|nr:aminopeptidase P family N-terminal domain-containing protein [Planctomycetota bacterium]
MFVEEEIREKKAKVRELLGEFGLDGILIKRTANFAWITGGGINYVGITSDVGLCPVLVTRDRDYVIANQVEAPRIRDEEMMERQGYELKTCPWYDEGGESKAVAAIIGDGKLGSDCGHPGAMDVGASLNQLRWSLTPWEIDRYRELGKATSLAIEETCMAIRPGDSECAVAGRLLGRLWENRIDHINVFCAADDRISRFRHPLVTERKIEKRAMLCVNSRKHGLIVSITRFVHFGKVPEDIRRLYRANVEIDCVFMANTVPGRLLADIFAKGVEAYRDRGFEAEIQLHHQGGPIGYVGRETRVHWKTPGVAFRNQAFAWNPSLTGSKSEDVMLAAAGGPELLTFPVVYPKLELTVEGAHFVRPDILET